MQQVRENKDNETEEALLQENIKIWAEGTNIAIILIILCTAIAVTGVFLELW